MQQERGKSKLCCLAVVAFVLCKGVVAQEPGTVQLNPVPETADAQTTSKSKDLTQRGIPVTAKVKLHPDPDSEVLVPEFNLIQLADGSVVVEGKYRENRDVKFGYVIDPVTEVYRTFEIDTSEKHARFGDYLQSGVRPRRPNPGESIRAKRILGAFNATDGGFDAAQPGAAPGGGSDRTGYGCAACWGQNTLVVRTIDILNITLAETASWISYFFDNPCSAVCNHYSNGTGSCYANPDTGLSHWFMDLCARWPFDLQMLTDGEYHNDDFLGGACGRTNVVHIAEVTINQYSGPNYWWQHRGNGLCYSSLFAVVMSGGINTCW
jgi:hypothetical protein